VKESGLAGMKKHRCLELWVS